MSTFVVEAAGRVYTIEADYMAPTSDFASMRDGGSLLFYGPAGGEGRRGEVLAAFSQWTMAFRVDSEAERHEHRRTVDAAIARLVNGDKRGATP